jgi:hypothetical protein
MSLQGKARVRRNLSAVEAAIRGSQRPCWCGGLAWDEMGGYGGGFNTPADGRHWDRNVCHTYHFVNYWQGAVSPTVVEGDNPRRRSGRLPYVLVLFIPPVLEGVDGQLRRPAIRGI